MKLILMIVAILLSPFIAFSKFSQVISISANDSIKKVDGFYQYENADLIIRYSFWGENGIMGFMIFNKSNKPIYIDWKKSAMIYNGKYLPYYTNKTISNYVAYGSSYGSRWANIFNGISSFSSGTISAAETVVKAERTTFIPPRAYVTNGYYNLISNFNFTISQEDKELTKVNNREVYVSKPSTPVIFRNYITYSANEDFKSESNIDNEFHIGRILTMHRDVFKNEEMVDESWQKPTRFYITDLKRGNIFEQ